MKVKIAALVLALCGCDTKQQDPSKAAAASAVESSKPQLCRMEKDTNADGKIDATFSYYYNLEGQPTLHQYRDLRAEHLSSDTFFEYQGGLIVSRRMDVGLDGVPNYSDTYTYDENRLVNRLVQTQVQAPSKTSVMDNKDDSTLERVDRDGDGVFERAEFTKFLDRAKGTFTLREVRDKDGKPTSRKTCSHDTQGRVITCVNEQIESGRKDTVAYSYEGDVQTSRLDERSDGVWNRVTTRTDGPHGLLRQTIMSGGTLASETVATYEDNGLKVITKYDTNGDGKPDGVTTEYFAKDSCPAKD